MQSICVQIYLKDKYYFESPLSTKPQRKPLNAEKTLIGFHHQTTWIRLSITIRGVLATSYPDWLTSFQSDSMHLKDENPASTISACIVYVIAPRHQEIGHYGGVLWPSMRPIWSFDCLAESLSDWQQKNHQHSSLLLTFYVGNPQVNRGFHGKDLMMRKGCPYHLTMERWRHYGTEMETMLGLPVLNNLTLITIHHWFHDGNVIQ